jgi:hypothetical protein
MLLFKCKIKTNKKEIKEMYQSRNWKPVPYTREEKESMAQFDYEESLREEEDGQELKAAALLSWTASNGAEIQVHGSLKEGFYDVAIDGQWTNHCVIVPAPAKYQAAGIVAVLGKVGLTAERKAVLESK